jgi:hypothetical protein
MPIHSDKRERHFMTGDSSVSVFTFERRIDEDEREGLVRRKGKNGVAAYNRSRTKEACAWIGRVSITSRRG